MSGLLNSSIGYAEGMTRVSGRQQVVSGNLSANQAKTALARSDHLRKFGRLGDPSVIILTECTQQERPVCVTVSLLGAA